MRVPLLAMPPPSSAAPVVFPVIVVSVTVTLPPLLDRPPPSAAPPVTVSPWSVTVAPEETAKTDFLSPVASTTAAAWPGHCSMVTVVETLTASSTVPATSMVAPEPASERAWEMVLQGPMAEQGLLSLPVEPDTKSVVAASAETAITRPTPRLPMKPSMPTAKTSTRRRSLPRVVPRSGDGPLFRPGKSRGMRRPPARATAGLIDGQLHRIEVFISNRTCTTSCRSQGELAAVHRRARHRRATVTPSLWEEGARHSAPNARWIRPWRPGAGADRPDAFLV